MWVIYRNPYWMLNLNNKKTNLFPKIGLIIIPFYYLPNIPQSKHVTFIIQ